MKNCPLWPVVINGLRNGFANEMYLKISCSFLSRAGIDCIRKGTTVIPDILWFSYFHTTGLHNRSIE